MEDFKKKSAVDMNDKEIVFSKAIKAGKRIYYLDVKKNRKEEMFLAITESKKVFFGEGDDSQISFEKHKIFLYKEDFEKFMHGLAQAIAFINEKESPLIEETKNIDEPISKQKIDDEGDSIDNLSDEIKIDIDFE